MKLLIDTTKAVASKPVTRLKVFRVACGLTQGDLARRAGISRQAVIYLERGVRPPHAETADALAAVFGVSVSDLFDHVYDPVSRSAAETP